MSDLYDASGDYEQRCRRLVDRRVAVWDVLASSIRPGSLDADIQIDTAEPNDFKGFFTEYDKIELVCFNGRKAEALFKSKVVPSLVAPLPEFAVLPSTSPAYASMSYAGKLDAWREVIERR